MADNRMAGYQTTSKADQPRVSGSQLKTYERSPGMAYNRSGIQGTLRQNRRDYSRK